MTRPALTITPLPGLPRVRPGDDLVALVSDALKRAGLVLQANDIVVVAQKIVSKSEGRLARLDDVTPSVQANELAAVTGKDPRQVQLVLDESDEVLRAKKNVMVVAHRLGLVMANAGIDRSNVEQAGAGETVLLLPVDPDASARRLKDGLEARYGGPLGVVITDSIGRAWRLGTVGHAIGSAGVPALIDQRGQPDMNGRALEVTETAFADSVASAAVLVMGEAAEGTPAALVRGLTWNAPEKPAAALIRPKREDMFR
ncbi:MAG TPA: coenzyme F420-0:L-glutamate ligase [Hyphomicrobiaceae bacterium]|nr:coenzyme F420-0:L-glutamate ligase [Hyphomicrobiaceae bacterium]